MADTKVFTRTFPAELAQLDKFLVYTQDIMEGCGCSFKVITQVGLALEEVFVNVANYAYPEKNGTLDFSIQILDGKLRFVLEDSGVPFDPLKKDDPDITLSAEERGIGGLGIFMVKKIMDEVEYRYSGGKNILTLTKSI